MRKTNLTVDAGAKLVGPRILNGSQWGLIDPIDTPDGGNIGLHKQLSLLTYVTRHVSREPMIQWLNASASLVKHASCTHNMLATMTKVLVNGYWAGCVKDPIVCVNKFKLYRRNGLIPLYCSICFDIRQNAINIFTDGGRLCRPIYYYDDITESMSYEPIMDQLLKRKYSWTDLVNGFNKRRVREIHGREEQKDELNYGKFYKLGDLYDVDANAEDPVQIKRFKEKKALLDYLDPNEEETSLIAFKPEDTKSKQYTHCEIHESLIFGMMCNLVIYPHHNPATRSSFSCGQSKQAVSVYHTNFNSRMDKTAVILNQGQKPLVKSRYLEYICNEENSYGENAIVAIMCYTGYNVEDAVLVNEGALKRGLFRTTYFSVYEAHEEKNIKGGIVSEKKFLNIEKSPNRVSGLQMGYDYSKIDDYGLVKEGTELNDSTILIGIASGTDDNLNDESKTPKKGQLGIVHKTFITEGEEGTRIAKVKVREERIPAIGDKMASRSGQKGTIGMIIPEQDMPFTKDGIRPDIIINPHAIPTRMTIGQLVECIVGKACLSNGYSGDCTAFNSNGNHIAEFARLLTENGMHSSGTEILYNGMNGEQVQSEIFMGPTYYMRLKHMVKDKVNFRAQGPRTQLTRQPVAGRANDGGLRIGEMERDSIISHGATEFLKESMLVRGDQYYMAVCNTTGAVAIYNPEKNLMMSPMADGPIKFNDSLDGKDMNVEHITKFGRSFSVVRVPYVFKLFMQELQTINVKMAIITEDNVSQFDNMNFSNNISLLSGLKLEDVINKVSQEVDELNNIKPKKVYYEELSSVPEYQPISPEYQPNSPVPEYQPNSPVPEYQPNSPVPEYQPISPEYQPNSPVPEYQPNSPEYQPNSPVYQSPVRTYKEKQRIEANYENFGEWNTGIIIQFQENNTYRIGYDTGMYEDNVPESRIRLPQIIQEMPLKKGDYVKLVGDTNTWRIGYTDSREALIRRRDENKKMIEQIATLDKLMRTTDPMQAIPLYKAGDAVSFKGDFDKNRKWIVDSIEGGFAVLKTEDTYGLDKMNGGSTKVVGIDDATVYEKQDIPVTVPVQQQPPIVLNIVNGDNNRVEQHEPVTREQKTLDGSRIEEQPQVSEDMFSKPMIKKPEVKEGGNPFSQGPLVVKKV